AARFGDRRTAAAAWQLSRRVAHEGLGHDQSRIARADNNLATLAADTGRAQEASTALTGVLAARQALAEDGDAAAWRRLTVTERTITEVARVNGAAVESGRLAAGPLGAPRGRP